MDHVNGNSQGTERIQPNSGYYLLAPGFLLLGAAIAFLLAGSGIRQIRKSMVRGEVPGQMSLELKQGETYMVVLERKSPLNAEEHPVQGALDDLACEIHAVPNDGRSTYAARQAASTNSWFTAYIGDPLFEFTAPHSGKYMVWCQVAHPEITPKLGVAVAGGASRALFVTFARSALLVVLSVVLAVFSVWRVTVLRLASRTEIRRRGLKPTN
jgi:hypothetical protein